ncbi:hypothetical protein C0993_009671, partial [Termitomyces sp. T159_Od127]
QQDGHNKLILQRDISTGNILIFENEEGRTFGRLIDYDHAKKASGMREVPSMIAGLSPSALQDKLDLLQRCLETTIVGKAENDVLDMAFKWLRLTNACGYIECVVESFGLSNHPESSLRDKSRMGQYYGGTPSLLVTDTVRMNSITFTAILRIIDEAIDRIKTIPDDDEATQAELDRRKRRKENRLATFRLQVPTAPPIPT